MPNKIISCPYCGWLLQSKSCIPEYVTCPQCHAHYEPTMVVPQTIKGKAATCCTHPKLQDAAGLTYCPDCGQTEW